MGTVKLAMSKMQFRPIIGLEIHAQILSRSKMFSAARVDDSAPVNSAVALFDLATPGILPVLNVASVLSGVKAGVLLNCEIPARCRFERKHYFYADMPAGFQITQRDHPIARRGYFDFYVHSDDQNFKSYQKRLRITRIQLENDSGKTIHDFARNRSLVDLNRAGVGLLEIVTEPELCSALEAYCFVEQLRIMLAHNGICEGEMHKGNLRVDANVSLGHEDSSSMGVRTEVKNINSLRSLYLAINFEVTRHYELLKDGGEVLNETRTVDSAGRTVPMREKEIETDYRFMPEPNLPTVFIDPKWIHDAKKSVRRRPKYVEYIEELGFEPALAFRILRDEPLSLFVDEVFPRCGVSPVDFCNWLEELRRACKKCNAAFPPSNVDFATKFAECLKLHADGRLTQLTVIDLFKGYLTGTLLGSPAAEVNAAGLWRIADAKEISDIVDTVFREQTLTEKACLERRPKFVNKLRNAVVNATNKRVDVQTAAEVVSAKLDVYAKILAKQQKS